jgi:hypothetical protein
MRGIDRETSYLGVRPDGAEGDKSRKNCRVRALG